MTSHSQPYAYVFEDGLPHTPWIALNESHPLSQLHIKYWDNPIQGNEPGVQTLSEGQPMDDDEDQPLDDDEDQSEVGPDSGCFVLDFHIKSLRISKLWVRQDYIRLYDYCNTHYNDVWSYSEPDWPPPSAPSVVITGQPGIGECFSRLRSSILEHLMNREKLVDLLCRPATPR